MVFPDAHVMQALMGKFLVGCLLFIRVLAMMYAVPIFSSIGIDGMVKAILAAIIALSMTMVYAGAQPDINLDAGMLVFTALKEVMVGSLLGFTASLVINAARFAGGIADFEIGFQTALLFDPNAGAPTLVGEIQSLMMTMLLFLLNGHHFLLESVFASAKVVPIDSFILSHGSTDLLVKLVTSTMIIGVKIAAPVLVAIFLTNISLALLSRVAPQMNIFTMSMHTKIIIGLLSLLATVPLMVMFMKQALTVFQDDLMQVLMSMASSH